MLTGVGAGADRYVVGRKLNGVTGMGGTICEVIING